MRLPAGPPWEEKETTAISAASLLHSSAWRISRPSVCPRVQQLLLEGGQYLVPAEVPPHLHSEAQLPQQTLQPPGVHLGPGPAGIHLQSAFRKSYKLLTTGYEAADLRTRKRLVVDDESAASLSRTHHVVARRVQPELKHNLKERVG